MVKSKVLSCPYCKASILGLVNSNQAYGKKFSAANQLRPIT